MWKRQLTAESAECCQTRDGSRRPSREAPAQTATGKPRMPVCWEGSREQLAVPQLNFYSMLIYLLKAACVMYYVV